MASTKAFTTQLAALMVLMACIARRQSASVLDEAQVRRAIAEIPSAVEATLAQDTKIAELAPALFIATTPYSSGGVFIIRWLKRVRLKLKEISYIHAEAYPAGELKHGPFGVGR